MLRSTQATRLRFVIGLTLALCVCAYAPALSARHQHKQAKQQIEELEENWRTATLSGDYAALGKMLSDEYVGIAWNGQVNTKEMQIDRLRNHSLSMKRLDVSDEKVKVVGAIAIVTGTANVEGSIDGLPMTGAYRYTRIYQKLPTGIWKITNFEATRINPGDPLHHARHPDK